MDTTKSTLNEEKRRIMKLMESTDPMSDDYAILVERLENLERIGGNSSKKDAAAIVGDILKVTVPAVITGVFSLAVNSMACKTSIGLVTMKAVEEASGKGVVPQWQTKFIPVPKIGK